MQAHNNNNNNNNNSNRNGKTKTSGRGSEQVIKRQLAMAARAALHATAAAMWQPAAMAVVVSVLPLGNPNAS